MKKFILSLIVFSFIMPALPEGCKGGNEDHVRMRKERQERKKQQAIENDQNPSGQIPK